MQTTRLAPLVLLVACSLEVGGTNPLILAIDPGMDPGPLPIGELDAGPSTRPCTDADDAGCTEPVADGGEPTQGADAGPETPPTCDPSASPSKPGDCGCGALDSDGDGRLDCHDLCPMDPQKSEPLICGCGMPDVDMDQDGIVDCKDACIDSIGKDGVKTCPCDPAREECGNQPPTVALVEPIADTVRLKSLRLRAEALDVDGKIERVTLFVDGKAFPGDPREPYQWVAKGKLIPKLAYGAHVFMVEAVDDQGAKAQATRKLTIIR